MSTYKDFEDNIVIIEALMELDTIEIVNIMFPPCAFQTIKKLAIGGYESTFLADLVASYLSGKAKANFHPKTYHGIYRDDGLVVFTGKKSAREIKDWLEEFQKTVNKAAGNQHLRFTAEKQTNEDNSPTPAKEEIFQIGTNNEFPFSDVKIS